MTCPPAPEIIQMKTCLFRIRKSCTKLIGFPELGYGTTELGYGTTNADAGVGIGLKKEDSEI